MIQLPILDLTIILDHASFLGVNILLAHGKLEIRITHCSDLF
jgi:hypothetical protein